MDTVSRRAFMASAAAVAGTGFSAKTLLADAAYPAAPVTIICPWGAGGGTDATARIIAAVLERNLGRPFDVVNRTGGSGVVGHTAIATAKPDGYTLGIITVEAAMMHWAGLTDLTPKNFTALALMNEDPPGIQVKADSPCADVRGLAEVIRASPPGSLKASGTGQGGIWHLALLGWLRAMGLRPDHVAWLPSNGAAPAMQDLATGGLDFVTCSVPEARPMVDPGKVRSLAVMSPERNPHYPDVPTLTEAMHMDVGVAAWRGIAAPKGLPPAVAETLSAALKTVFNSSDFKEFMSGRGFGMTYADPEDFETLMDDSDRQMVQAMQVAGIARR